ncbi:MAG: hypothetical protein AAGA54_05260, partial [Myxococcota bacterium]
RLLSRNEYSERRNELEIALERRRDERARLARERADAGGDEADRSPDDFYVSAAIDELEEEKAQLQRSAREPGCPTSILEMIWAHRDERGLLLIDEDGTTTFHPDIEFLVPIDAPWKAALVRSFAGGDSSVGSVQDGYVFFKREFRSRVVDYDKYYEKLGPCDTYYFDESFEILYRIDRDGRLTEVERRRVEVSLGLRPIDECLPGGGG